MEDNETAATDATDGPSGPMLMSVGLYMVDRQYGGPEEGGWFFDSGELVEDPSDYERLGATPRTFADAAGAEAFVRSLEPGLLALNEGRPDIGHSNSRGQYELMSFEGASLPKAFPERRPTYE